ncbi:MAG TPA: hypothetical protein VHD56_05845 [Tepidisphaeraceae bacterium]|nr:hypothetical protein [Tepidisphaeraceae bacterium]
MLLQWFGPSLGGQQVEQQRWIAILQAILAGWVTYVGATGMVVEGILRLPRIGFDLLVGAVAASMYLYSAGSTLGVFFIGRPFYGPLMFHWTVLVLVLWCGGRWAIMSRTNARE